ncbi:DUF3134 domain-containing protein [Gloeocapsa sp. PCC 73106]|uniref:DUF3134 domain-containing protein n=1 Tax=Gloeocapsa sp. PCC 73106 TaxID=102232 RepID=UPI0002ABBEB5|nr:DUF3134 domain-containing protein [Gloeocapsa sp. PCC 73106]ELS00013.1 Protein of unknown function (DUF3134) [Gloeocapsa sp. PCC 73106]
MHNPSLRREPRYEPAPVIPLKDESSLIDWLAQTGRLKYRETTKEIELDLEEDEEIAELIDVDDYTYEEDSDDVEDIEE